MREHWPLEQTSEKFKIEKIKNRTKQARILFSITKVPNDLDGPFGILEIIHLKSLKEYHASELLWQAAEEIGHLEFSQMMEHLEAGLYESEPVPPYIFVIDGMFCSSPDSQAQLDEFMSNEGYTEALFNSVIHLSSKQVKVPKDSILLLTLIKEDENDPVHGVVIKSTLATGNDILYFKNIKYAMSKTTCFFG